MPNTAGTTRFSIDFRTLNIGDLRSGLGAPSIDNSSRGTTLRDFLSATDFAPLPAELIDLGANGSPAVTVKGGGVRSRVKAPLARGAETLLSEGPLLHLRDKSTSHQGSRSGSGPGPA